MTVPVYLFSLYQGNRWLLLRWWERCWVKQWEKHRVSTCKFRGVCVLEGWQPQYTSIQKPLFKCALNNEKGVQCMVHWRTRLRLKTSFITCSQRGVSQRNPSQHSLVHKHQACQNSIFHAENRQPCACFYNLYLKKDKRRRKEKPSLTWLQILELRASCWCTDNLMWKDQFDKWKCMKWKKKFQGC